MWLQASVIHGFPSLEEGFELIFHPESRFFEELGDAGSLVTLEGHYKHVRMHTDDNRARSAVPDH